jgi:hypothetical protein
MCPLTTVSVAEPAYHKIIIWLWSPLLSLGRFFQFLDPTHSSSDSLVGGSARHKVSTCTQTNTNTDSSALSGIRAQESQLSIERTQLIDCAPTVIGVDHKIVE